MADIKGDSGINVDLSIIKMLDTDINPVEEIEASIKTPEGTIIDISDVEGGSELIADMSGEHDLEAAMESPEIISANIEEETTLMVESLEVGATTNYKTLVNKPKINDVELVDNKTTRELNINIKDIKYKDKYDIE